MKASLLRSLYFLLSAIFLAGCATIPPDTYRGSASGYNVAMQEVGEEQLLLNIVRLRYRDAPYFFEASSITSQFDLSTSAGVGGNFPLTGDATDVLQGNTGISFSERPTISYTPLQGEEFFQRLLGRVPFSNIALLTNSGWSLDTVSRMVIQRTNGLPNAVGASGPTPAIPPVYEDFRKVSSLLFELQKSENIQLGELHNGEEEGQPAIYLPEPGTSPAGDQLREMLSLDPALTIYKVTTGSGARADKGGDTIEINNRSLLGVLFFLSQGVNVPEQDRESGLATTSRDENGRIFDWNEPLGNLFRVESSSSRPDNASTAVRYRSHWFYIRDTDLTSKSTFILLSQMFTLQTGDARGQIPVLTIPVAN